MQHRTTENKRLAIFNTDYQLRIGLMISKGDEFLLGRGYNEFHIDEEGNLVVFVGEFTPHRIHPRNFDVVDEIKVTTVNTYRRTVKS